MSESQCILRLFSNVCDLDIFRNQIRSKEIIECIEKMRKTYEPRATCLTSSDRISANYAEIAHRCAYLHKYAPFHTALTCFVLRTAFIAKRYVFETLIKNSYGNFHVCSLGGGPGTDVIAVTALLHEYFGHGVAVFAKVLDSMPEWHHTFSALHNELQTGKYGFLSHFFGGCWEWRYYGVNLLDMKKDDNITDAISTADMVTMVKFVSAAACVDTSAMIQKIFDMMKPGALILYIDNDTIKFDQLIMEAAEKFKFEPIFGPLKHFHYVNELFNIKKFGYTACFETKVNVHILQKPLQVLPIISKKYPAPHEVETSTPIKGIKRKAGCFGKTNLAKRLKSDLKEAKHFFTKTKKKIYECGKIFQNWKIPKRKPLLSIPLHSNQLLNNHRNTFYQHEMMNKSVLHENEFQDYERSYCEQNYTIQDSFYQSPSYRNHSNLTPEYRNVDKQVSYPARCDSVCDDVSRGNLEDSFYRSPGYRNHSNKIVSQSFTSEYRNVNKQDSFHEGSFNENLDLSISPWSERNDSVRKDVLQGNLEDSFYRSPSHRNYSNHIVSESFTPEYKNVNKQDSYPERFDSFYEGSFKENLDLSRSERWGRNDSVCEDVLQGNLEDSFYRSPSYRSHSNQIQSFTPEYRSVHKLNSYPGRFDSFYEDSFKENLDLSRFQRAGRNDYDCEDVLRGNLNLPISSPPFYPKCYSKSPMRL